MEGTHPIFVIGSYRSGTSVLTWAIGQHPNILPLEETNWIYRFSVGLINVYDLGNADNERTHLGSLGITRDQFTNFFGEKINEFIEITKNDYFDRSLSIALEDKTEEERKKIFQMNLSKEDLYRFCLLAQNNISIIRSINDPKTRWIDGTPENSHYIYGLNKLFPNAKFIHILRNPKKVAKSLMNFSTVGQQDYPEENAYRTWMRLVKDAVIAEKALGSERVLRVYQEDLENDPRGTIEKCLSFVGEEFHEDCLLPLKEKINSSSYKKEDDYSIEFNLSNSEQYIREAYELYEKITKEFEPIKKPDSMYYEVMENNFINYAQSQKPNEIEALSAWGASLALENARKDNRILELERKLQATALPIILHYYGPHPIMAGKAFNIQLDGSSAIWVGGENISLNSVLYINDIMLHSTVIDDHSMTATVPDYAFANPANLSLYIKDAQTNFTSKPIDFIIHP